MKAQAVLPQFTPCSMTLTFESQKELDAIATMFNHTDLVRALGLAFDTWNFEALRVEAKKLGGNASEGIDVLTKALREVTRK